VFDAEDVLNGLLRGALGGRRKHSRRARHAFGSGSIVNAKTMLAAAGVAWGLYETWQQQQSASGGTSSTPASPPAPASTAGHPPPSSAHPVPTAAAGRPRTTPPPLPVTPAPAPAAEDGLPPSLLQLLRLMISAARADGEIGPGERERILAEAREVGAEADVRRELEIKRPLAEIVAGASDPELRSQLYSLAFTIVRADEAVSSAERIYLAQLSLLLALEAAEAARIEEEVSKRIDAARPGA
jgi:uncharacterized membrane protein YebE (DUF533 family)